MSAIPESPFREMGVGPETLARVEEALKKKAPRMDLCGRLKGCSTRVKASRQE
ncbi:hypothetical protein Pmar_PMAR019200 [Perkinsus marinus ATCC 50983]|uniref:Uncharacterized protein n=1 Tax=Perkinsus marinus (strain ATCC 50983 / TXsc) TaxID=423536 RepID=C5KU52_PERM5|nr:hypothetical protein Pmar_PMAR019200 [Perkinsus marinus ATCC 50983]EER12094.1 hypothetical protein Pmar_PMAR019200 [Perkinsus marinus ATCC 50983]|eukprot:XP_002780299.1 hypothetical protein Pmar_PMAR019200 [Perkinsus marinus ATCC 50983]